MDVFITMHGTVIFCRPDILPVTEASVSKHETRKALRECTYPPSEFFLQLLCRVGEGDGALLKPSLYLEPFSK